MITRAAFSFGVMSLVALGPQRQQSPNDDIDPAFTAQSPSLRVLLGGGSAQTIDATTFSYEGRRYRGTFTRTPSGVVTTVPLEGYLYSVVSREMSEGWPPPALQAQAVCARTYALQRSSPRRDYDVESSESSQVYAGLDYESPACSAAVDATVGQVLRYGGSFASIAYSSSCGGHTESAADAWGGAPTAYLSGVPCPWCTAAPDYRWTVDLSSVDVARAFPPSATFSDASNVRVQRSDASGRASAIVATDAANATATVDGGDFRSRLGTRVVRSLLIFAIAPGNDPGSFVLNGGGLGHGVGLCQWGAKGMALAGHSSADILALYFPGTTIGRD